MSVNTQIWDLRAKCYSSGAWFASMNMQQHEPLAWDFCPVLASGLCVWLWIFSSWTEARAEGQRTADRPPPPIFFLLQRFTLVPVLFSLLNSGKVHEYDSIISSSPKVWEMVINYLTVVNRSTHTLLRVPKLDLVPAKLRPRPLLSECHCPGRSVGEYVSTLINTQTKFTASGMI